MAASGTYGYGVEFERVANLRELGAIVAKGLSREPMKGNPPPRLWETDAGMMNSVGLQNIGVRAFVAEKLSHLAKFGVPVIANVFGYAIEDYTEVVRVLNDAPGIAMYEINASCPNTKHGGMVFSADPGELAALVNAVKAVAARPIMIKLSPNVTSIPNIARAAEEAGADALSLVNTFVALAIDLETRRPRLGGGTGGLSGPAIKPIALRMVSEAFRAVKIPLVGLGGIASGTDAAEFLVAGATAVQVGTASFWDPEAPQRVAKELEKWLRTNRTSAHELTGTLKFS
ncbi:MAG: dihydroorotate dehydrogenase [Bryobacteraceae bacterium]|nr:dihydroorotate dehydrogenase [Bryobacteraceae bacterium]